MVQYINKSTLVVEIERRVFAYQKNFDKADNKIARLSTDGRMQGLKSFLSFLNTLEVKEVDISNISENLAEADEYLDYTTTGNLAHNKPMVSARLKRAIQGLFDAGLFELTHDIKYRMEKLGLKTQKGE